MAPADGSLSPEAQCAGALGVWALGVFTVHEPTPGQASLGLAQLEVLERNWCVCGFSPLRCRSDGTRVGSLQSTLRIWGGFLWHEEGGAPSTEGSSCRRRRSEGPSPSAGLLPGASSPQAPIGGCSAPPAGTSLPDPSLHRVL